MQNTYNKVKIKNKPALYLLSAGGTCCAGACPRNYPQRTELLAPMLPGCNKMSVLGSKKRTDI